MEKLKNILSPGHKKDDDQLYGNDQSTADSTSHSTTHANTSTGNTDTGNTGTLSGQGSHFGSAKEPREPTVGGSHSQTSDLNPRAEKDTGLSRQILNPGNDKYDETRYGPGGTATTGHTTDLPDRTVGTIHSQPAAEKDHGIARQILNPGNNKYDETRYGSTGTVEPASHSRVNEPHGTHGTAGTAGLTGAGVGAAAAAHHSGKSTPLADDSATIASIKDGVIGEAPHSKSLADSASPVGREEPGTAHVIGSSTDRSFPLAGSQTTHGQHHGTHGQHHGTHDPALGTHGQHHGTHDPALSTHGERQGINDGRQGLAGAAGAATALPGQIGHEPGHDHDGHGHQYQGPNTTGSHGGPHATQTANMLDPNISGTHGKTAGYDGSSDPSSQHHYGRDAALAGGATAAAGGLYEEHHKGSTHADPASKTIGPHSSNLANIADPRVLPDAQKMKSHDAQSTATDPASMTTGPHQSNMANVADPRVLPEPEKMKGHTTTEPHQSSTFSRGEPRIEANAENQHHYGRDAALAGGAGAGAAGAYEAAKGHNDNPYAAKDIDPRVDPSRGTGQGAYPTTHNMPESSVGGGAGSATGIEYNKHDNDKLEKERSKTEKKHEKEMEKAEKKHEKEAEKQEKEAEKQEKKEEKKQHGGLISSLLHRGDKKSSTDESSHHHAEQGVGAGTTATSTEEELDRHHHNKLHKDPPAGYAPVPQSGYPETTSGQHQYGNTAASGLGNRDSGIVIDPQSGLPMESGKFDSTGAGAGAGGLTDTNSSGLAGGHHTGATHGTTDASHGATGTSGTY